MGHFEIDPTQTTPREKIRPTDIRRILSHFELGNRISAINERLSRIDNITSSEHPMETLFNILTEIMSDLCSELDASRSILLYPFRNSPEHLHILSEHPAREDNREIYNVRPEEWQAIGNGRGLQIYRTEDDDLPLDLPLASPEPPQPAESVVIRVGAADDPHRFMLIVTRLRSGKKKELTYRDLADAFHLLALRLNEIYNLALHREREILYDQERSEFVQDVMHQLIGSLSAMNADIENLIGGYEHSPTLTYHHLHDLINMLQKYAQTCALAADKRSILEVYTAPFETVSAQDLVQILERQCESFSGIAKRSRLDGPRVEKTTFKNFPPLYIQRKLFELVIFNLLDNAVKYSAQGVNAPITIEGQRLTDRVIITVTNHGIPLSSEDAREIFKRYTRSESAATHVPNGTGVGLYICRNIMQIHSGSISAGASVPSDTADNAHRVTFSLELPFNPVDSNPTTTWSIPEQQPTILYVEDADWKHQGVITRLKHHFDVKLARTSDQALAMLEADPNIRLVLLDIRLELGQTPGSITGENAGVELADEILNRYGYDVPIVCYTGTTPVSMIQELEQIGVKQVLNRASVSMDELVTTIQQHLRPR